MIEVQHFQIWILLLFNAMELPVYVSATGLGHLTMLKPTIIGRNIMFQLNLTQPPTSEQFANCTLKVIFNGQTTVQTINIRYSRFEHAGMKLIELDRASVNSSWDKALIQVDCNHRASNYVLLEFQADKPVLGPLCTVINCTDCVCVKPGDTISCITSSTQVSLWIGNRNVQLERTSVDSVYTYSSMHDTIKEENHQIIALCSATYYNSAVFNVSSFVYVYIPPKDFTLFVPDLLEDNQVNITCIAQRGRPPPMLEMYLDGENITGVSQEDVFDENTRTYTSKATLQGANRTWNNKNITCRLCVRNPDGKYVFEKSTGTTVTYRSRPKILNLYVNKTCGNVDEVCLTCFVRSNPQANISLSRPGQHTPIIECVNTTACSITISTSGTNLSEYECMASNLFGTERQTIVMYGDLKGKDTHNGTGVLNPLKSVMIGVGVSVMAISTAIIVYFIKKLRRRKVLFPKLIPMSTQVEATPLQQFGQPDNVSASEEITVTIEHHYDEIKEELGAAKALNQPTIINQQISQANIHVSATIEHHYEDIEDDLGATKAITHSEMLTPNERPHRDLMRLRHQEDAVRLETSEQLFELNPTASLANPAAYEPLMRADSDPGHKYTSLRPRCTSSLEANYVNII